jgi:uncharacterized SAM-binding protein YcdF (DUF218 family)
VLLLVLAAGCALLWSERFRAAGRTLTTAGALSLLLLAYGIPFDYVAAAFEHRYPPVLEAATVENVGKVQWIVVLGGGHRSQPGLPASSYPDTASLYRIVEGIRLHRGIPDSRIIFSGGGLVDSMSTATAGADLARALGVSADRIVVEARPESTAQEARLIREIVRGDPFLLVTSAVHMPRAVMLFRGQGLNPIPAPTEHRSGGTRGLLPSLRRISDADAVFHELVGIGSAWLQGGITR